MKWRRWIIPFIVFATSTKLVHAAAAPLDYGPDEFTTLDSSQRECLLSTPFYFPPGKTHAADGLICGSGSDRFETQTRVLSRYPADGSVRGVMLRCIVPNVQSGQRFTVQSAAPVARPPLLTLTSDADRGFECLAGPRRLKLTDSGLAVYRGATLETTIVPLAPNFPARYYGPNITVVENGPLFAWVRCVYMGFPWNVTLEVKADRLGQVECITRLTDNLGTQPFVPFGFNIDCAGAAPGQVLVNGQPESGTGFQLVDDKRRISSFSLGGTTLAFPDGADIRQGRLRLEGSRLTLWRDAALDDLNKPYYNFAEGQQRSFKIALPAVGEGSMHQVEGIVDARRRAAVVMDSPPADWGDLSAMRAKCAALVPKLQCHDGDDYGDVAGWAQVANPVYSPTPLTRVDMELGFIEDYYLGGSAGLRQVALDASEDYLDLHLYDGWDLNAVGGERYYLTADDTIPSFNQKGLYLLAHAYDETGDPRYLEAGLAAMDRAVAFLKRQAFLPSYVFPRGGFGPGNNTRSAYFCRDLLDYYRYTGNAAYRETAQRIIENLEEMRERTGSRPELTMNSLTGQPTSPLLAEGVADPTALGDLALHNAGSDVLEDTRSFPKPFILDYHLHGANAVYAATGSPAALSLMQHTADYLVNNRSLLGSWGYPHVNSLDFPVVMPASIGLDLLESYQLTGDRSYLETAMEQAKLLVQMDEVAGDFDFTINVPVDKPYYYARDWNELDVRRGHIESGWVSRDGLAHFMEFMDCYFQMFPGQTAPLRAPLRNPVARWFVEHRGNPDPALVADYQKAYARPAVAPFELTVKNSACRPDMSHAFLYNLSRESPSDSDVPNWATMHVSTLRLFENGKELGPAHSLHADIREKGDGRWSHWGGLGARYILFSTSDNSDPRSNGRVYTVRQPAEAADPAAPALWRAYMRKYPGSPLDWWHEVQLEAGTPGEADACTGLIAAYPSNPRSGAARLRLYQLTGDKKWLHETMQAVPGSLWAREAATLLWAGGDGPRPNHLLVDDGAAQGGFTDVATLNPAAPATEISARLEGATLVLTVLGRGWRRDSTDAGALEVYFDVDPEHEHWIKFEVDADTGTRRYQGASTALTPGLVESGGADWSSGRSRNGNDLTLTLRIPLQKLGVPAPVAGRPALLGLEVLRRDPDNTSFWCRSCDPGDIFTGDFGRLLLK